MATGRENIGKLLVTKSYVSDSASKEPVAGVKNDALKIGSKTAFLLIFASLALVALVFHKDVFSYSFVGSDIPTLIESSRIHSFDDVIRIFGDRAMAGTAYEVEVFYRPVSFLTYSLDYALWGLNPLGFHLTDFLLHLTALFLAAYLIFRLTRSYAVSLLSGLIFTVHPIIIENLAASSRRQPVLPVIFMLISLIFFIKYVDSSEGKRRYLGVSLAAYLLALGSHEIAIVLPVLLFSYQVIFGSKQPWKKNALVWVKTLAPFLVITFVFWAWRTVVLRGVGGYGINIIAGGSSDVLSTNISSAFFTDLLYPGDLFSWLLGPFPSGSKQILLFAALIAASPLALIYGWRLVGSLDKKGRIEGKILMSLLVAISLASVALVATSTNMIGFENPQLMLVLRGLMPNLLILLLLLLVGIVKRQKLKYFYQSFAYGKLLLFAAIWMVLPLFIFLPSFTFSHRSMYLSVIPFSVILAVFLVEGLKNVKAMATGGKISLSAFGLSGALKTVSLLLVFVLALSFPLSSFLIKRGGEWKAVSSFTELLLTRVAENVDSFPGGSEVEFNNLPNIISYFDGKFGYAKQITYPEDYTIKSWMDLTRPDNNIKVTRREWVGLRECPADLHLRIEQIGEKKFRVDIDYVDGSCAAL